MSGPLFKVLNAAWDAAGATEREWQTGRLMEYLNGEHR